MGILEDMLGGGGMGLFGGGSSQNPADAASPYLQQIPGVAHKAYDPYIQRGQEAGGVLSGALDPMAQDPTGYLEKLMQSYRPSRAYQMQQEAMTRAAGNTAAAGGMRGTPSDISGEARITDRLMGQDMQQWLQNVMGIQRTGIGGEQNLYGTGFGASRAEEGDLSNVLGTQAQLAFQGSREEAKRKQDEFGGLLSALGSIGGFAMGGPAGGAAGGALGTAGSQFL